MPAAQKSHKFPFPEDWEPEAEQFMSDTEMTFDDAPEKPRFPDTLFVYNLPKVQKAQPGEQDKFQRLQLQIKKKLGNGEDNPGFELDMRLDEKTGESTGCAWLKYPNKKEMEKARKVIDGYTFGKNKLSAIPFDEYERILETTEQFVPPASARANLAFLDDCRNWLLDDACREQILLRFGQETEIHWLDSLQTLVPYYCGEREKEKGKVWCDWKVMWSRHGNYLVTCHKPGICIWGGDNMVQKRKFIHDSVTEIEFSPTEEYLITWNGSPAGEGDRSAYKIWNVQTGRILKEVATPLSNPSGEKGAFPHMVWSPDSKFFARCTDREINVHEMPSCKEYKIPGQSEYTPHRFENGVAHFKFSPKDNIVSVWSPQLNDSPSCLTVLNVETGERLQTRSRTNFNAKLEWQSEGDFLCVILTKKGKMKDGKEQAGGKTKNLDILRMREKNIPVETVDIEENIKGFFWEPKSNRFALLTEHKESSQKSFLAFYSLANSKCEQIASFELNSSQFSKLFWAPEGQYFVVAAMGQGELIWGRLTEQNNMELLYKDEQVNVTNVEWDSTGRYVLTSVSTPIEAEKNALTRDIASAQDAGFTLWTFQGRPLHTEQIEKLFGAGFRPKPPSLLKPDEEKDIRRQLKVHSRRFEQIDDDARTKQRREEKERKEHKIAEFRVVCHTLTSNFKEYAKQTGWEDAQERYRKAHQWVEKAEMTEEMVNTTEEFIEL